MSKYKKFEDDISKMAPIFSKRVKKLLAENAMTQKDLAEKIDVSESSVSGWLSESSRKGFSDPKLSIALTGKTNNPLNSSLKYAKNMLNKMATLLSGITVTKPKPEPMTIGLIFDG